MQPRGYATLNKGVRLAEARCAAHRTGATPVGTHLSQALLEVTELRAAPRGLRGSGGRGDWDGTANGSVSEPANLGLNLDPEPGGGNGKELVVDLSKESEGARVLASGSNDGAADTSVSNGQGGRKRGKANGGGGECGSGMGKAAGKDHSYRYCGSSGGGGHAADEVLERHLSAGRPVSALLRSHSAQALGTSSLHQAQLSLSRSLAQLAPSSGPDSRGDSRSLPPNSTRRPSSSGAGARPQPVADLRWQPPEGRSWAEMPSGSRLVQAISELIETEPEIQARLEAQLSTYEEVRPDRYVARTHALAAVHPQAAAVANPQMVHRAAEKILASYPRKGIDPQSAEDIECHESSEPAAYVPKHRPPVSELPGIVAIDRQYAEKPPKQPAKRESQRAREKQESLRRRRVPS